MPASKDDVAARARFARHGLWAALVLIVLLGVDGLLLNVQPAGPASHYFGKAMLLLPLAIVLAVAALRSSNGARIGTSSAAARVVRDDELRQLALQRAFRGGFLAMLLCQPAALAWFAWAPLAHEAAIMAVTTVLAGVVVFLGSLLLHDRG